MPIARDAVEWEAATVVGQIALMRRAAVVARTGIDPG
jgi:hypothetical protein